MNRLVYVAFRLGWVALLLAHTFWFVRALVSPEASSSSPLVLFLSLIFFVLKALDVAFLRVQWNRRSLLCAALVVVLLHTQVFDQALLDDSGLAWLAVPSHAIPAVVLMFGAAVSLLLVMGSRQVKAATGAPPSAICALIAANLHRRLCALAVAPLRGPPVSGDVFA